VGTADPDYAFAAANGRSGRLLFRAAWVFDWPEVTAQCYKRSPKEKKIFPTLFPARRGSTRACSLLQYEP